MEDSSQAPHLHHHHRKRRRGWEKGPYVRVHYENMSKASLEHLQNLLSSWASWESAQSPSAERETQEQQSRKLSGTDVYFPAAAPPSATPSVLTRLGPSGSFLSPGASAARTAAGGVAPLRVWASLPPPKPVVSPSLSSKPPPPPPAAAPAASAAAAASSDGVGVAAGDVHTGVSTPAADATSDAALDSAAVGAASASAAVSESIAAADAAAAAANGDDQSEALATDVAKARLSSSTGGVTFNKHYNAANDVPLYDRSESGLALGFNFSNGPSAHDSTQPAIDSDPPANTAPAAEAAAAGGDLSTLTPLFFHSNSSSLTDEAARLKSAARCFNCGSYTHALRDCQRPRDHAAVAAARAVHAEEKGQSGKDGSDARGGAGGGVGKTRYYGFGGAGGGKGRGGGGMEERFEGLVPGVLSAELRAAMGIGDLDPPPWLRRMRDLGYPPGYLGYEEDTAEEQVEKAAEEKSEKEKEEGEDSDSEAGEIPAETIPPKGKSAADADGSNDAKDPNEFKSLALVLEDASEEGSADGDADGDGDGDGKGEREKSPSPEPFLVPTVDFPGLNAPPPDGSDDYAWGGRGWKADWEDSEKRRRWRYEDERKEEEWRRRRRREREERERSKEGGGDEDERERKRRRRGRDDSPDEKREGGKEEGREARDSRGDKDRERDRDRGRDRSRERGRDRSRERGRDRSRERGRDRSREKGRDRSKERGRESRDRIRDRSRERYRDRSRERGRDSSRERGRDRSRERNRDRSRERNRGSDDKRREEWSPIKHGDVGGAYEGRVSSRAGDADSDRWPLEPDRWHVGSSSHGAYLDQSRYSTSSRRRDDSAAGRSGAGHLPRLRSRVSSERASSKRVSSRRSRH
ncbi:hypothetical protein CLOM_g18056 [Closterium sp. NIES-68]|nr:hypothetical protein CLOM_g18056 [Closterium sp. NIES-68]GJP78655.1 hypothetical protein CLOP_g8930 [Closterium sp. NIES-67]